MRRTACQRLAGELERPQRARIGEVHGNADRDPDRDAENRQDRQPRVPE
jgi:hypothetical protein